MLHPTPTAETLPKTVSKSLFYFNVIYLYVINSASSYIFFKFSSENLMIYLSVFAKWGFEKSRIGQVFFRVFRGLCPRWDGTRDRANAGWKNFMLDCALHKFYLKHTPCWAVLGRLRAELGHLRAELGHLRAELGCLRIKLGAI